MKGRGRGFKVSKDFRVIKDGEVVGVADLCSGASSQAERVGGMGERVILIWRCGGLWLTLRWWLAGLNQLAGKCYELRYTSDARA